MATYAQGRKASVTWTPGDGPDIIAADATVWNYRARRQVFPSSTTGMDMDRFDLGTLTITGSVRVFIDTESSAAVPVPLPENEIVTIKLISAPTGTGVVEISSQFKAKVFNVGTAAQITANNLMAYDAQFISCAETSSDGVTQAPSS